jgi:glutamate racemase
MVLTAQLAAALAPRHRAAVNPAAPLLFFDSGVGGLSVLAPTRALLPNGPIVYVADSAGFPYGQKSDAELASRVPALLGRLVERFHPRLVVIACNTASTIALDHARAALDVPIVGTVPAIKPGAEMSKSRVIGVLGTEATVRQPYVDDLAARFASDCTIIRHGSPELVELAEAKLAGEEVSIAAVKAAAQPMFEATAGDRIDTVVLACTHFPLLGEELRAAFPNVAYVDGGPGIARRVAYLTREQPWPVEPPSGIALFTSPAHEPLLGSLAAYGLDEVQTL